MLREMRGFRHLVAGMIVATLGACAARVPPPSPAPEQAAQCLARLDQLAVGYTAAATPVSGHSACAVDNPVTVTATTIAWNQPGLVSCGFAVELDRFAREVVAPAAWRRFGKRVSLIRHFGTYACRRESGSGRWSQHATGRAIDIAGFALDDGTEISVEHDWRRSGPKRDFLRDVARGACERFSLVLTPNSDREHYNHIHLDDGPYRRCGA